MFGGLLYCENEENAAVNGNQIGNANNKLLKIFLVNLL